jgi:hypothetical protein
MENIALFHETETFCLKYSVAHFYYMIHFLMSSQPDYTVMDSGSYGNVYEEYSLLSCNAM